MEEALEDTFEKEGEKKKPAKKGKLLGAISSLIKDKLPLEKAMTAILLPNQKNRPKKKMMTAMNMTVTMNNMKI